MARRSASATVRAFFAVELGEEARREAEAVARWLRSGPGGDSVGWVRAENYHVTLRFLGSVATPALGGLVERARWETRGLSPFELHLTRLQVFPSPRHPRVVTLALEPEEPLAALAEGIERASVACGLAPEARRFRAHVTLGRVRDRGFPAPHGELAPAPFRVENFALFQSVLSRAGAIYTALERILLGGIDPSGTVHP